MSFVHCFFLLLFCYYLFFGFTDWRFTKEVIVNNNTRRTPASAHAHFTVNHYYGDTRHSVLLASCDLPFKLRASKLPKSATSQSMWVLSCTVKLPGLAHDSGRGWKTTKSRKMVRQNYAHFISTPTILRTTFVSLFFRKLK